MSICKALEITGHGTILYTLHSREVGMGKRLETSPSWKANQLRKSKTIAVHNSTLYDNDTT